MSKKKKKESADADLRLTKMQQIYAVSVLSFLLYEPFRGQSRLSRSFSIAVTRSRSRTFERASL